MPRRDGQTRDLRYRGWELLPTRGAALLWAVLLSGCGAQPGEEIRRDEAWRPGAEMFAQSEAYERFMAARAAA